MNSGSTDDRDDGIPRASMAFKIMRLLEAVAATPEGVGVRDVARDTGIDKSAVSRLFNQLQALGVVEQSEASGRFSVGARLFALGATIHGRDSLWQAAEPVLRQMVDQFDETCYLATREHDQVMFREKIDCNRTIRYVIELGQVSPLHAGAGGRAILAGMQPEEVERVLGDGDLEAVTADTITDRHELLRQVDQDRQRGYSVSMSERVVGGTAVAAPFFRADGYCRGSLVYTCPAERFDMRRVPEIADAITAASHMLSSRLGFVSPATTLDG